MSMTKRHGMRTVRLVGVVHGFVTCVGVAAFTLPPTEARAADAAQNEFWVETRDADRTSTLTAEITVHPAAEQGRQQAADGKMHGLVNRTIQGFVTDTYGPDCWESVSLAADLGFTDFEAMLIYDETLTLNVLAAVSDLLDKPRTEVLEDIGTYLVSHPNAEAVRRLLRFGGEDFVDFLHSLDDLPDRARLAVADLELPQLELREHAAGRFSLTVNARIEGFGFVMIGMLRSLADDYGALVLLEHRGGQRGLETVDITLIEAGFAQGRRFELGAATTEQERPGRVAASGGEG